MIERCQRQHGIGEFDPRALARMLRQVDRLTSLVNDLLDVSRIERGKLALRPEPVDLAELVAGVVEDFRGQAPLRALSLEVPGAPVVARVDAVRIEQVLANLLENALRYTPEQSPVEIRLGQQAGQAQIEVTDHGPGIPLDQQPLLFTRFYRVRSDPTRPHGGLGLGLYISRQIIELHGGEIGFSTAPDRGSTFFFRLPLA